MKQNETIRVSFSLHAIKQTKTNWTECFCSHEPKWNKSILDDIFYGSANLIMIYQWPSWSGAPRNISWITQVQRVCTAYKWLQCKQHELDWSAFNERIPIYLFFSTLSWHTCKRCKNTNIGTRWSSHVAHAHASTCTCI